MKTDMMSEATSIQDENTKDIFILNCTISVISGSANPVPAMTCAAPEGTPPRRFNELKTPPTAFQRAADACHTFTIFHGLGENHSRSFPFPLNRFSCVLKKCIPDFHFLIRIKFAEKSVVI